MIALLCRFVLQKCKTCFVSKKCNTSEARLWPRRFILSRVWHLKSARRSTRWAKVYGKRKTKREVCSKVTFCSQVRESQKVQTGCNATIALVSGFGSRVMGFGLRVSGCGVRVSGFGFKNRGFKCSGLGVRWLHPACLGVHEVVQALREPQRAIVLLGTLFIYSGGLIAFAKAG